VDLYTWEILEGLEFKKQYENEAAVIQGARERLAEIGSINFLNALERELATINANWALLPTGATVIQADDARLVLQPPPGCVPYYIVNYRIINERARVLVNRDIVTHALFTTVQQGALKVHEAVYAWARIFHYDTDSTRAQEITALMVADTLTVSQKQRLIELTKSDSLEIKNLKLTAVKDFNLEVRSHSRANPHHSSTTQLLRGNTIELAWGNWNKGIWYYSSFANDFLYKVKKGDVFIISSKGVYPRDNKFEMKRTSDNTVVSIGIYRDEPMTMADIKDIGLFEVGFNY
jgi:hypothetical protein